MVANILCSVTGHKVARNRVWHDRISYRSKCIRCGTPMIRASRGWRPYEAERDDHDMRNEPVAHGG